MRAAFLVIAMRGNTKFFFISRGQHELRTRDHFQLNVAPVDPRHGCNDRSWTVGQ